MLTDKEKKILRDLARYQRETGFDSDADLVDEYIRSDGEDESPHSFLCAVENDVWWHFEQAGDEDEYPIYEEMADRVIQAREEVEERVSDLDEMSPEGRHLRLDEEQQLLMLTVADYWVKKGFYRGRAKIMPLLEEHAWVSVRDSRTAQEWVEKMDAYAPLARAIIYTEYGTPKPYNRGAYYDELDAVLEPLGYKHYVINDAVVAIMVDPYSDEGERIMEEHGF